MKKLLIASIATAAFCGGSPAIAAPPAAPIFNWIGFYVGLNAGYAWSGSVESTGVPSFANPPNQPGSGTFASALANLGTYRGGHNDGFIGGGQIGYNWKLVSLWVAGIEADIQGLAHHDKSTTETVTIPIGPGQGSLIDTVRSTSRSLDWLGTIRGRLGVLATPTLLVYGTGGLAYGGVKMNASATAPNSGNVYLFPVTGGVDISEMRTGWTAGAGLEWMFLSNWSAKVEYLHYDLGRVSASYTLAQGCRPALDCPGSNIVAAASAIASTRFDGDIVRAGVNYHF